MLNQKGFTLIEIAVVMIIIGLLVGFGASLVVPLSTRAKRMESTEIVDAAVEAVMGYAVANNGSLPTVAQFSGIIQKRNDAWQNPICYIVDDRFTDNDETTGDLCTRKTTYLSLNQCDDSGCTSSVTVSNAAFVILSGGANFNNQTSSSVNVSISSTINVYGPGIDNVDNDPSDFNRPEEYDDIVQWVTLNELRTRSGCNGPQMSILNGSLPPGDTSTVYNAAIYIDGGVPFASGGNYNWCIETDSGSAPAGLTFRNHLDSDDIEFTTDGASLAEASGTWVRSDHVQISGTPTTPGSYLLTIWVRDNNNPGNDPACNSSANQDNYTEKSFVLTVNP